MDGKAESGWVVITILLVAMFLTFSIVGMINTIGKTMRFIDYHRYDILNVSEPLLENGIEKITVELGRFVIEK